MKTFWDECVWIFLAAYLLIVLLTGTALGNPLNNASRDTVKVSQEKLNRLTSRDYPIYSVLLNKSRQATVRIFPQESYPGCLDQLAKEMVEVSFSDWQMPEDLFRLPAPLLQRKVHHHPIPFHILKVHF